MRHFPASKHIVPTVQSHACIRLRPKLSGSNLRVAMGVQNSWFADLKDSNVVNGSDA